MKDILLITNYWHFEEEKASSRYFTLANMIVESGLELEIVTSTFYHATKSQRKFDVHFLNSFPYKITLINEPGYLKNVSLKRIISHRIFAKNVLNYVKKRKKPDVIYCVVPSLDVAELITDYANENEINVIVDIQDLWPEAYKMVINIPVISDLIFYPMKLKANNIYSSANDIVAVSESYVSRALEVNKKITDGHSVYLGIELQNFDKYASEADRSIKPENEIWLVYIGTLGHSYDLISVIDAIELLENKGYKNLKFIVIGEGPRRKEFEAHAKQKNINCKFTGKLEYCDMVKLLSVCDIAVNPITKNSAASIINKHADYVAAGLPIVNTQESKEFRVLLENYKAGVNCENGDILDLANKFSWLIDDNELRKTMGSNSRKLAEDRFDRIKTYNEIVNLIKDSCKMELD